MLLDVLIKIVCFRGPCKEISLSKAMITKPGKRFASTSVLLAFFALTVHKVQQILRCFEANDNQQKLSCLDIQLQCER